MNNKLLAAALAAGVALPVAALPLLRLTPPEGARVDEMKAKTVVAKAPAAEENATVSFSKVPAKKIVTSFDEDLSEISKYGELELVLDEDFHRLKNGSIEEPYLEEILRYFDTDPRLEYPWTNMLPELTEVPGWGVDGAYAAGECVYFGAFGGQSHINTPMLDLTGEGGNVAVLEFKAKAAKGETFNALAVEAAETNHMGPTWDMNENIVISDIGDEWRTIRLIYQNCGPSFIFNIVTMMPGDVFIDDIKVYKMKPYLHIPQPTNHTLYNGTDFTVNWEAAPGVDKYLLTVYELEIDGTVREYLLKDEIVEGTSYKVENAVSGNTYYYTVASYKEGQPSIASMPKEVTDLETPKMEPVTLDGEFGYQAKWNFVPGAEVYDYMAFYKRTAEKDGEFVVCQENFDGITDSDGNLTGWTKEGVQNQTMTDLYYAKWYPNHMQQRGWYGLNVSPFTDYISLAGFFYGANKWDNVGLLSPELDLSKDGGKVTVNLDLAGEEVYYEDEKGNTIPFVETCAVVLFNWNDQLEDYEQVELVYVDRDPNNPNQLKPGVNAVSKDWQNYTVTMTKGTDRSIIGIYAIWGISNLYVDNLKITQNYKAGDTFLDPFYMANYVGVTYDEEGRQVLKDINTVDVTVPVFATGTDVYHSVRAVRAGVNADHNDQTVFCESQYSEKEFVRSTILGVGSVELSKANVSVENGIVTVSNPDNAVVNVYDLNGHVIFTSSDAEVSFTLPAKGLYLVAVGHETVKVVF